ncbi:MAG: ATP-dependent helicase [Acidobacteria bacterium]|nr:ATP-dependent helicase [Acidobacteriota bacterium]
MSFEHGGGIDLERDLNPAQRAAVEAGDGAQLVIAGAGSGKTRTLVYRVAHLVAGGEAPESILLLTFTRKAAQEMLRRATQVLDERCARVAGGTFHSFANRTLRRYAERVGFSAGFTILDRSDAEDLVGILRSEAGFDRRERRFPRKNTILDLFSKRINTGRSLEQLLEEDYPHFADELRPLEELEGQYAARKRRQNVLDYDDLLVFLRQLLRDHEGVRRRLSATYRHVLVDEYQDTNKLQAHIAALLVSGHGNLMVVGDDAQSIYSFRGASFRNMLDFPKIFPGTTVTVLEQSYRSTQPILDLANGILAQAKDKYSKSLFTEVEGNEKPHFVRTPDDFAQARFIVRKVLELREEGVSLSKMAVLSRAAWHSNSLEVELGNANIPFRKFGGLRFVEAAHVKDVSAFLRLAVNPLDDAAWFRVLQLFEGVGPRTARDITAAVATAGGDLAALEAKPFATRRYAQDLKRLRKVLEALADDASKDDALAVDEKVAAVVAYYRPLLRRKYDDATRREGDLEALQVIAERYRSVERFLSDIALDPPEVARRDTPPDSEDEWLTVSTVHSAKGLEWHSVFVLNLTDGHFPSHRAMGDEDAYEEERRLLYVAATRAQQNLFLLHPEELPSRGGWGSPLAEVSPLLTEIEGFDDLVVEETFSPTADEDRWADADEADGPGSDRGLLARIDDYFGH